MISDSVQGRTLDQGPEGFLPPPEALPPNTSLEAVLILQAAADPGEIQLHSWIELPSRAEGGQLIANTAGLANRVIVLAYLEPSGRMFFCVLSGLPRERQKKVLQFVDHLLSSEGRDAQTVTGAPDGERVHRA